jgi:hypothetical protein
MITESFKLNFFSPIPPCNLIDPQYPEIMSNLVRIVEPLRKIRSRKAIDIYVSYILPEYWIIKISIISELIKESKTGDKIGLMGPEINGSAFELLKNTDVTMFTREDRENLLEILRENIRIFNTISKVPNENAGTLLTAIIKGSGSIQKLDLIMTVIGMISTKAISEFNPKVIHNLCILAGEYLSEFRTQIFMNNPVLKIRLQEPGKTISNVEMERLLALSS